MKSVRMPLCLRSRRWTRPLARCSTRPAALDRLLAETAVIVTSDHGHCEIGNDGGLHAPDSLSPVIATAPVQLPAPMRSIDIAPVCRELLGI